MYRYALVTLLLLGVHVYAGVVEPETPVALAMEALREALNFTNPCGGPPYIQCHYCNWSNVQCVGLEVTSIKWAGLNLNGTIPGYGVGVEIWGTLNRLLEINLGGNSLNGTLPLNMTNATSLRIVDFQHNQLSGTIPSWNFLYLRTLRLNDNGLTGTLSRQIMPWNQITELALQNNFLSGAIPDALNDYQGITELRLANNSFHGSVPTNLLLGPGISILDLESNQLTGSLYPSLRMPQLTHLSLGSNSLSGPLPDFKGSPNLATLMFTTLDLTNNGRINGTLASNITSMRLTSLRLSGTKVNVCHPDFRPEVILSPDDCDLDGLDVCGCSLNWPRCGQHLKYCPETKCTGPKPFGKDSFCSVKGWAASPPRDPSDPVHIIPSLHLPAMTNITISGQAFVFGTLSVPETSFLIFDGIHSSLWVENEANLQRVVVYADEEDLDEITKPKSGHFTHSVLTSKFGAGTIHIIANITPSCKQVRQTTVTTMLDNGYISLSAHYSGFYSACATWIIPAAAVLHLFVFAGGVAYAMLSYSPRRYF